MGEERSGLYPLAARRAVAVYLLCPRPHLSTLTNNLALTVDRGHSMSPTGRQMAPNHENIGIALLPHSPCPVAHAHTQWLISIYKPFH